MKNNVLVIGDCILDHDIFCDSVGLSLETPTLKTKFNKERFLYGGTANVVEHLLELNNSVTFITAVAYDKYSDILLALEKNKNLNLVPLFYEGKNVIKSRYWVSRGSNIYKYLQINQGSKIFDIKLLDNLKNVLKTNPKINKAVLIDYGNGLLGSDENVQKIISILKDNNISVFCGSQKSDRKVTYQQFIGSDVICMNSYEAESAIETLKCSNLNDFVELLKSDLCVTDGSNGCFYHTNEDSTYYKSFQVNCIDSCGAGDAFLAALVTEDDCVFANKWAALSVTKLGTEVPKLEDINDIK
jgi:bifunctional ADP-heptose synthase (sugar kinase/adenylyltransferase)